MVSITVRHDINASISNVLLQRLDTNIYLNYTIEPNYYILQNKIILFNVVSAHAKHIKKLMTKALLGNDSVNTLKGAIVEAVSR
jgi:hypothetical protein